MECKTLWSGPREAPQGRERRGWPTRGAIISACRGCPQGGAHRVLHFKTLRHAPVRGHLGARSLA